MNINSYSIFYLISIGVYLCALNTLSLRNMMNHVSDQLRNGFIKDNKEGLIL